MPSDPSGIPTADEIFGRHLTPVPWPSSRQVLAIAVELLPTIEDDLTADLVAHLVRAIVNQEDELRAVRAVLSASLTMSHERHSDIGRLKKRLADLLDERRPARTAAV